MQLPKTLEDWRYADYDELWSGHKIWDLLRPVLARHRLTAWVWLGPPMFTVQPPPGSDTHYNGYTFVGPSYNSSHLFPERVLYFDCVVRSFVPVGSLNLNDVAVLATSV